MSHLTGPTQLASMILRTETVQQSVNGAEMATLIKDVVMTPGASPLGMVRKRPLSEATHGAVMLLHGFGQNRYVWHSTRRSFSTCLAAAGWDVFNVDLRGAGRSRRFGARGASLLTEYIQEDLPSCVQEATTLSGQSRVYLIGHSMGGIVAYGAAATSLRDRVAGIVSLGSPYLFGEGSPLLRSISGALRALRFTGVFDSNPALPLRWVGRHFHRRRRVWDARSIPFPIRPWMPGSVEDEVLDEYLRRAFDWTTLGIAFDIFRAGYEQAANHLSEIRLAFEYLDRPLLVIAGSEDGLAPPTSVRPAYDRSRSRDRTYRVFPAGHVDLVLGRSAPYTVWSTVLDWLGRRVRFESEEAAE